MYARIVPILFLLTLTFSCGEKTEPQLLDPQADADSSNDAGNEATGESEMMFALTAAEPGEMTTDDELAEASATASAQQFSADCLTSVTERNVVTYTFTECTGPFGFVTMSGELVATYTRSPEGVRATVVGSDLSINEGTASLDATVLRTQEGTATVLQIDTNWHGETKDGDATSRVGDYTTTVDPVAGCISLDGDWTTTIGAIAWNTVVAGFEVCRGGCPKDGGSIEWQGARVTTTVEYDGSSTANWSNSNGRSGTVRLFCGS